MFKSGYVAIVGKPNVGKSTLINNLIGYKVAITTPKPQTTRFNIKGIRTTDSSQIIFIDTPGIHVPKHKLGEYMMKGVSMAIHDVDVIIYLVDATRFYIDNASKDIIKNIVKTKKNIILGINKIDKIKKEKLLEIIELYNNYMTEIDGKFCEIIPISVYKNDGIDLLIENIEKYIPEGEKLYLEDELTDITEREIVEEVIREKLLNNLEEEVPHGTIVEVQSFKTKKDKLNTQYYNIDVDIICEKMSHKGIIIGKAGLMLKKIGSEARIDIEKMLDTKVNLKLWVKVRPNWQKDDNYLKNIKNKLN